MISEDDKAKIRDGDFNHLNASEESIIDLLKFIKFIHERDMKALHEEIEVLKKQLELQKK